MFLPTMGFTVFELVICVTGGINMPEQRTIGFLDVFRGIDIAGMVLVNNPGRGHIYWPLEHAEWNGWTPTDLIFPFFLFIVGIAIPLAFGKRIERGDARRALFIKVLYRSAIIFLLGEFLAGFPYFHLSTIRIPGVLQRIAVCYLLASIIYLTTGRARWRSSPQRCWWFTGC
jgi:predicted acyltransferase